MRFIVYTNPTVHSMNSDRSIHLVAEMVMYFLRVQEVRIQVKHLDFEY